MFPQNLQFLSDFLQWFGLHHKATQSAENQETLKVFFFPAWIDKSQGLIQINFCSAKCYWAM